MDKDVLALVLSIMFSWAVGVAAARNKTANRIIIPVLDVLQSVPMLGFFPVVLVVFVAYLFGWIGVNLAVIFLIFTSMSWNIARAFPVSFLREATMLQSLGSLIW